MEKHSPSPTGVSTEKKTPSQCKVVPAGCSDERVNLVHGRKMDTIQPAAVGATRQTSKPSAAGNKEPAERPVPSQREGQGEKREQRKPRRWWRPLGQRPRYSGHALEAGTPSFDPALAGGTSASGQPQAGGVPALGQPKGMCPRPR